MINAKYICSNLFLFIAFTLIFHDNDIYLQFSRICGGILNICRGNRQKLISPEAIQTTNIYENIQQM